MLIQLRFLMNNLADEFIKLKSHFGDMQYWENSKLPPLVHNIYLLTQNDNVLKKLPKKAVVMAIFYVLSSHFAFFRPESFDKFSGRMTHLNLNYELFAMAGSGKDALISKIRKLFVHYIKRSKGLMFELNTQYKLQTNDSKGVYYDNTIISEGTPEGLQTALSKTMKQRFGSLSYEHGELNSLIKADHAREGITLTSEIVKCYDADKVFPKSLAKKEITYGGTPFFFWGHTSYQNITDTAEKATMFAEHLSRGMHRRTMICIVRQDEMKNSDGKDFETFLSSLGTKKTNEAITEMVEDKIMDIYDFLKKNHYKIDYREPFIASEVQSAPIMFKADAEELYLRYVHDIQLQLNGLEDDEMRYELTMSKIIKVKKITTTNAITQCSSYISLKNVKASILFVEMLAEDANKNLKDVLDQASKSFVYEFLKTKLGENVTKTNIVEALPSGSGSRKKRFDIVNKELEQIANYCYDEGFCLTYNPKSKKSKIKLTQIETPETEQGDTQHEEIETIDTTLDFTDESEFF